MGSSPTRLTKFFDRLRDNFQVRTRLVPDSGSNLEGHRKSWLQQVDVFTRALVKAQHHGGRVVSIHSRRAASDVLKCIAQHTTTERVLPILHWFSGSIAETRRAIELGCYFSINQRSLEHDAGVAWISELPDSRLLTETDGPFVTVGGRPAEPRDVVSTAARLADVRHVSAPEMTRVVITNAQRVLAFAGFDTATETLA